MQIVLGSGGPLNEKSHTRRAFIASAGELLEAGDEITMPAVAQAAEVSAARACRYFPDIASLMLDAVRDAWGPLPELTVIEDCDDPVVRIVSAESLLTLVDLSGLSDDEAVATIADTAGVLTAAASDPPDHPPPVGRTTGRARPEGPASTVNAE